MSELIIINFRLERDDVPFSSQQDQDIVLHAKFYLAIESENLTTN